MSAVLLWRSTVTFSVLMSNSVILCDRILSAWYVIERSRRCTTESGPRFPIRCSEAIIWWFFVRLYEVRNFIEEWYKNIGSDVYICVIYQNTIRRVHLQMGQLYKYVHRSEQWKKRVKITLIVKRHLTFVVYLNLVIDD